MLPQQDSWVIGQWRRPSENQNVHADAPMKMWRDERIFLLKWRAFWHASARVAVWDSIARSYFLTEYPLALIGRHVYPWRIWLAFQVSESRRKIIFSGSRPIFIRFWSGKSNVCPRLSNIFSELPHLRALTVTAPPLPSITIPIEKLWRLKTRRQNFDLKMQADQHSHIPFFFHLSKNEVFRCTSFDTAGYSLQLSQTFCVVCYHLFHYSRLSHLSAQCFPIMLSLPLSLIYILSDV